MLVWFQKCWSDFKNVGLIEYDFFPEEARISCGECLGNWIVTWNIPESELVDTKEGSNSRSQSAVWVFRIENPGIENQNLPTFYHLPRASFSFWGAAALCESRKLRIYIMRTDRIIDIYRIFWRVYRKNLPRTFLRASDLQRSFWRSAYDAMPNNLVQVKWGRTRKWSVHSGPKWSEKSVNWLREQKREIRPTFLKSDQLSWNQTNPKNSELCIIVPELHHCVDTEFRPGKRIRRDHN